MYDYLEIINASGVRVGFFPVPLGTTCAGRSLYTDTPLQRSQIIAQLPDAGVDYDGWEAKGCLSTGDVIVTADNTDYTAPAGNSPATIGASRIDPPSEPTIMDCYFEWITVNGQPEALLKNRVPQPAIIAGGQRMWWVNGADETVVGNWLEKSYPPGTALNVYYGEGPQKEIYDQGYVHKAYQFLYVGLPNT